MTDLNDSAKDFYRRHQRSRVRLPRRSGFPFGGLAILVIVLAIIVGGITFGIAELRNVKHVTFTVEDKAVKTKCDNGDCNTVYMIYTDHGVFKDEDSFFFFKFDSSDLYGKLHRGKKYDCKTSGFRIHFTSNYPNLISCEAV